MTYLDRAIKDGYAIITGPENKQKIIYVTSDNHTENYNDPEEKVRAEFWAELIYEYDYPAHRIKVEVTIPDRVPTDRADIVIFSDDECKKPYAVVECKRDGVTDAEFLQAIEQGVGNATWVKLRASYVVIIAGATRRVLDFSDDSTGILERENNIIADLPKAYGKPQAFRFYRGGEYTDVDGKKKKAPDIQPVAREDLITAIKKCHNTLWGGGRLSPPTAFGELCKLIFVKISDEQKPRKKGEPYQFQIKTHEPSSKLAERINALYNEQKVKDPEVFTDSIKVDDRVLRTVVSHLESINLNKTDLDVKGVAFEQFMDGFFKGDFGQYFTPRPIIEFAVKMMKPEHDWDVLDPACGSGGFLLHALDYMRSQASEYYDKDTVDYFNYWHDFASKHLYGIEINDEIARVAKMNMIVHDDGHTNVISFDALDSIDKMHDHNRGFEAGKFDLILTNPPFGSTITKAEKPYLANYELGKTKDAKGKYKDRPRQSSEILFIERIWEFLKPGTGKAAIVLPDGVLTNSSAQYVRDFILEKFQLLAVVSLPQCAFAHFGAGVKTSIKSLEKSTQLSEKAKMRKSALLYLIETNLYLVNERKEEAIDSSKLSELLSFAKWIIYLQNSSDLCFHTDSDTKLIVEDDYRIDVELGENYSQTFEKESQRRIIAEPFNLRGDNTDRDFFEKVANAFYEDLGVHFKVLESVLHHLSDSSFSHDNVEFDEIAPNVIKAKATDVLNDYLSFVVENVPVEDVKSAYDFLTIVPGQLKTICDTTHPILPIWEREKRNHCFAVRPIYMSNNDYIYSPIIMEEVRKRWIEGFLQFYPPFEIGLERTCTALYAWKNNYEHLFSSEVEVLLKESGCEYAKHDVDLRREDRRGNHPTIDVLGDYDVIGLNTTQKRIFIIECKVLQPIGSVFEHSNQQKRFFTKEKFDEKFQKRIDYFSKVAMSFFANHGYDTEGFTINPYMVVNKVFSSYYKHVQFPIVTFDELKREIQL